MEKEFFNEAIGGDGGKVILGAEKGLLKVEASFPILKLIEPATKWIKGLIPGEKFDGYVDVVADAALKFLGVEKPQAPAEEPAPVVI